MKVALALTKQIGGSLEKNLKQIVRFSSLAKDRGVGLLLFEETFLQGFEAMTFDYQIDKDVALSLKSKEIGLISRLASSKEMAIGFGFYEIEEGRIYDSYLVFAPNGQRLAHYRRISGSWRIKNAPKEYACGYSPVSFYLENHLFGIAVCGDLFDEQTKEKIEALHSDILLWPSHCDFSESRFREENESYAKQCQNIGKETFYLSGLGDPETTFGKAAVYKDGEELCSIPGGVEGLLVKSIN